MFKFFFHLPLNLRLFFISFILIVFTAITTGVITFFYFKNSTEKFYTKILDKKEENVLNAFNRRISNHSDHAASKDLNAILDQKILESSAIQEIPLDVYNLNGDLLVSSKSFLENQQRPLNHLLLNQLAKNEGIYRIDETQDGETITQSYNYLYNALHVPIGILRMPFILDRPIIDSEISVLFRNIAVGNIVAIILALVIAWFATMAYRRRLSKIILGMQNSHLLQTETSYAYHANDELGNFLTYHNLMIKKFQQQSEHLLKYEREMAWKEIAKQVAHEIKNPLTPMRLLIQNFQLRFNPLDANATQKVDEFSAGLIYQIDVLNSIATAFSDYTNMPKRKDIPLDLIKEIKNSLTIFNQDAIHFTHAAEVIYIHFDRTALFRIITNLVKNAFQAIPEDRNPTINIVVENKTTEVIISIEDNGTGISKENMDKLFIPEFSTKSTGYGLGLPMVKKIIEDYNGFIEFYNNASYGTTFVIKLPLNTEQK